MEKLPKGAWPVIAEEKWRVFIRDIFTALAFLYSKGLFHGDIKGNSFAPNHLRLEIVPYNKQIIFFIGSHSCPYQISLAMGAMPGRSSQVTIVFKNFKQF